MTTTIDLAPIEAQLNYLMGQIQTIQVDVPGWLTPIPTAIAEAAATRDALHDEWVNIEDTAQGCLHAIRAAQTADDRAVREAARAGKPLPRKKSDEGSSAGRPSTTSSWRMPPTAACPPQTLPSRKHSRPPRPRSSAKPSKPPRPSSTTTTLTLPKPDAWPLTLVTRSAGPSARSSSSRISRACEATCSSPPALTRTSRSPPTTWPPATCTTPTRCSNLAASSALRRLHERRRRSPARPRRPLHHDTRADRGREAKTAASIVSWAYPIT